jgi:hypothetical protein
MQLNSPSIADWQARRLKFSLRCAAVAALGSAGFSLIATQQLDPVPILSSDVLPNATLAVNLNSLSSILSLLTLTISAIVVALGFRRLIHYDPTATALERQAATIGKEWIGRFAVSLAVSLMLLGAIIAVMLLWARLFEGALFTRLGTVALATGYGSALAFGLAYWSVTLKTRQMLTLALVFMVYGVIFAALVSADRQWWQRSLSALGHDSAAGLLFNLSVVFGGLILLAVAIEEVQMLSLLCAAGVLTRRGFQVLRISLITICILMIASGLFPTRVNLFSDVVHVLAAHGMIVVIILLMFTVTAFAPIFPQHFKGISAGFGAVCVGSVALYGLGVLNFVTMEVLLISTCGAWLFYFKTQTEAFARRLSLSTMAERSESA